LGVPRAPALGMGAVRVPTAWMPSAPTPTKLFWMEFPVAGVLSVPSTWMPSSMFPETMLRLAGVGRAGGASAMELFEGLRRRVPVAAVGQVYRAGGFDADEVALEPVAVALDEDADAAVEAGVRLEAVDGQAADGAAAAAGPQHQPVGQRARRHRRPV